MRSQLHFSKHSASFKIPFTTTPEIRSRFFHVQTCGIIHTKADYFLKRDTMDGMQILVLLKGRGKLILGGKEYGLRRGTGFLIDCKSYHELYSDSSDPMVFCFLHFNGLQSREYTHFFLQDNGPLFKSDGNDRVLKNIRRVILAVKRSEPGLPILCSGLIHEMLTDLMLTAAPTLCGNSDHPDFIRRVMMQIEERYFEDLSLEDLAREAAVSKYHFTREFKKHCGQSAYDYLLSFRLNKAKEMLLNSNETVGEIAVDCGFGTPSHFSRSFKAREGLAPLEYRKLYRSSEDES